jgi:hypothetical protein
VGGGLVVGTAVGGIWVGGSVGGRGGAVLVGGADVLLGRGAGAVVLVGCTTGGGGGLVGARATAGAVLVGGMTIRVLVGGAGGGTCATACVLVGRAGGLATGAVVAVGRWTGPLVADGCGRAAMTRVGTRVWVARTAVAGGGLLLALFPGAPPAPGVAGAGECWFVAIK